MDLADIDEKPSPEKIAQQQAPATSPGPDPQEPPRAWSANSAASHNKPVIMVPSVTPSNSPMTPSHYKKKNKVEEERDERLHRGIGSPPEPRERSAKYSPYNSSRGGAKPREAHRDSSESFPVGTRTPSVPGTPAAGKRPSSRPESNAPESPPVRSGGETLQPSATEPALPRDEVLRGSTPQQPTTANAAITSGRALPRVALREGSGTGVPLNTPGSSTTISRNPSVPLGRAGGSHGRITPIPHADDQLNAATVQNLHQVTGHLPANTPVTRMHLMPPPGLQPSQVPVILRGSASQPTLSGVGTTSSINTQQRPDPAEVARIAAAPVAVSAPTGLTGVGYGAGYGAVRRGVLPLPAAAQPNSAHVLAASAEPRGSQLLPLRVCGALLEPPAGEHGWLLFDWDVAKTRQVLGARRAQEAFARGDHLEPSPNSPPKQRQQQPQQPLQPQAQLMTAANDAALGEYLFSQAGFDVTDASSAAAASAQNAGEELAAGLGDDFAADARAALQAAEAAADLADAAANAVKTGGSIPAPAPTSKIAAGEPLENVGSRELLHRIHEIAMALTDKDYAVEPSAMGNGSGASGGLVPLLAHAHGKPAGSLCMELSEVGAEAALNAALPHLWARRESNNAAQLLRYLIPMVAELRRRLNEARSALERLHAALPPPPADAAPLSAVAVGRMLLAMAAEGSEHPGAPAARVAAPEVSQAIAQWQRAGIADALGTIASDLALQAHTLAGHLRRALPPSIGAELLQGVELMAPPAAVLVLASAARLERFRRLALTGSVDGTSPFPGANQVPAGTGMGAVSGVCCNPPAANASTGSNSAPSARWAQILAQQLLLALWRLHSCGVIPAPPPMPSMASASYMAASGNMGRVSPPPPPLEDRIAAEGPKAALRQSKRGGGGGGSRPSSRSQNAFSADGSMPAGGGGGGGGTRVRAAGAAAPTFAMAASTSAKGKLSVGTMQRPGGGAPLAKAPFRTLIGRLPGSSPRTICRRL